MGLYRHNKSILLSCQTTSLIRTQTDNINEHKNKHNETTFSRHIHKSRINTTTN